MIQVLVLVLLHAVALEAEGSCNSVFVCADGSSPQRFNDTGYEPQILQLASNVVVTRLFKIKSAAPPTCAKPCDPSAPTLIPPCGSGACVDRGDGEGCCQSPCSDDPLHLLSDLGISCQSLVSSISCDAQLAYLSHTIGGHPHVREVCPYTCGACSSVSGDTCLSCTSRPRDPICTADGYTATDDCDLEGHDCTSITTQYEAECYSSIYGIITQASQTEITVQQGEQLCTDDSAPLAMCSGQLSQTAQVPGPTFDGAWIATQRSTAVGTAIASLDRLGPGAYVRVMYGDERKDTVHRVDIMQLAPETYDYTDLDLTEVEVEGVIEHAMVGSQQPLWVLLRISTQGLVFNVTAATRVRNYQLGNGVPMSIADLAPGTLAVITYIGDPFPYPNVVQATRVAVSNVSSSLSAPRACRDVFQMWCSKADACQVECEATESLCPAPQAYCDGECNSPADCSSLVDVWGALIHMSAPTDSCPGSENVGGPLCADGTPTRHLEVHVGSRSYFITSETHVGSMTGWALAPLEAALAARTERVRVEFAPSNPDLLFSFWVVSADNVLTTCGDDPDSILKLHGWQCESFLVLGCDYDLRLYSDIFSPLTPVSSVCREMCGECGNSTEVIDVCTREEINECLDTIAQSGCPTGVNWHDTVVCRSYRFCSKVNLAIAKVCEVATAPPNTPCSSERERAQHGTVGAFIPECNEAGDEWAPKQCQHDLCWCVDVMTGVDKAGTHTNGSLQCGFSRDSQVEWCDESFNSKLCARPSMCPPPHCAENECALRTDNCCAFECKEVVTTIDPMTLHAPKDIVRNVEYRVLTVTLQLPTPVESREKLHSYLAIGLGVTLKRLVLKFDESRITVLISVDEALLFVSLVKPEDQILSTIHTMQVEQEGKVLLAEHLFKTDAQVINYAGQLLVSNVGRDEEYMVVGIRADRQLQYVADFGTLGTVTFLSDEFETVIEVNLPNMTNTSVSWMVHQTLPGTDGVCPPADDAVYDPSGSGMSSYCVKASSTRFQYCRVGDLVNKHGVLVAGSKQTFSDITLPLNGWASVHNRLLVLGTEPVVCARIGVPFDVQLVADFDGPYLRGRIEVSQSELGRDTQLHMNLLWQSPIPTAWYNVHIHTERIGVDMDTRCDDAGQHYNPLHIEPNKCPESRIMQSVLNCELGDLTGKYGTVRIPGEALFTDPIMDTVGSEFAIVSGENSVEAGMSIVIHALDGSRIDCANLIAVGTSADPPADTTHGSTAEDDRVNTIILMVGVLLAVFVAAALIGYLARHYVSICIKGRAVDQPTEQEKQEIVIPVGRSANVDEEFALEMSEVGEDSQEPAGDAEGAGGAEEDTEEGDMRAEGSTSPSCYADTPKASQSIDLSQVETGMEEGD